MSFWKMITGEFIDIIEWLDDDNDTMVHRFERHDNEIKYGAKLTVREGQIAVFVNEGQLADIFEPGMYELETANLPVLTTLKHWSHGFDSPFKAEVYFINTRAFHDLKWGTKNPVMLRDPEFGPIRLRAFGSYVIRVSEPEIFLQEIISTRSSISTYDLAAQLRNILVARFTDVVGESKIPALDMAGNYDEFGDYLTTRIQAEFVEMGLSLEKVLVENISLPPKVEEALDKRASMGIIGDLSAYTQYQAAEAIEAAATSGGDSAMTAGLGAGIGVSMGAAIGNQMGAGSGSGNTEQASPAAPPPLPQGKLWYVAVQGQQDGPHPMDRLPLLVSQGKLTRATLVWSEGMTGWIQAGDIAELSSLFKATPPPIPH